MDFKTKTSTTAEKERKIFTHKAESFSSPQVKSESKIYSPEIKSESRIYSPQLKGERKTYKIKNDTTIKHDFKTKETNNINTIKNIGLFHSKKIAAFTMDKGYKMSKMGVTSLLGNLAKESENNKTAVSEAKKLWVDSYVVRNFASKHSLKGASFARYNLEKQFLKENVKPINKRTAFSPFKSRRIAFNKKTASQQKAIAKMLSRKTKNKIISSLGINTSGRMLSSIKRATRAFNVAGKALGVVVSTIGTAFKIMSAAILPLLFVLIIISVVAVAISGDFDTADLDMLTGTAKISKNIIGVDINKDDDTNLISFETEIKNNKFSYNQRTIRISGSIKKNTITIKGKFGDKEIALEGVIKNGNAELTGFMGDKAIRALSGSMFGSEKSSRIGKRIIAITKKYDNPYSTYPNMCLAWVYDVYKEAGVKQNVHGSCASEARDFYAKKKGAIPVGALVFSSPSYKSPVICSCGRNAGHVGIYIGNNKIIGSQIPAIWTLDQWNKICGYGGYYMPKE